MKFTVPRCITLLAFAMFIGETPAQLPPLLPRAQIFRPPDQASPLISPDGSRLVWILSSNGIPNLWVRDRTNHTARMLSFDPRGSVRQPLWQLDSQAVLFLQDAELPGSPHLLQAHVDSGNIRDLTPFAGVQARLIAASPRVPDQILVAMNLRDRRSFDAFRIHLLTGAVTLEAENTGEIAAWFADLDLNLRLAQIVLPNGELALSTRNDPRSLWRPILRWGQDDALGRVYGFDASNSNVFLLSSVRAQAPRLLSINVASGATAIAAQDARFDVSAALFHPRSNVLQAAQFHRARAQWQVADTNLLPDLTALRRHRDADLDILSRDQADRFWTVAFTSADAPIEFALYDRADRTVAPLFTDRPGLDSARLGVSRPISLSARDGLVLDGYLTIPAGIEPKNLPTVVLVHGGPWSRVLWGFEPTVQWLANRGYAVLQINFRGSTGYGKDHVNAGDKEWGGKMLLDLVDARNWAVEQGYSDPKRVAIMGTGFGGFATLAALAQHPTLFAAGVSLGGPPNLITMIQAIPASSTSFRALLHRRVGNPETDAARLTAQSPVSRAALIRSPLFLAATPRDPQAPAAEIDSFVAAIRREGRNVDYLFFPDEGASVRNPVNLQRFYAATEAFLARHLQGRVEPPSPPEAFESLKR